MVSGTPSPWVGYDRRMSVWRVAACAFVVLLVGFCGAAIAHKMRYGGTVKVTDASYINDAHTRARYKGVVKSPKRACEKRRVVQIRGSSGKGKYRLLGKARTDGKGKWEKKVTVGPNPAIASIKLRVPSKPLDATSKCATLKAR